MIGLRINNYEVVSLLGEGGMGAVYLAIHPVLKRRAAVKVLLQEFARDPDLTVRFVNEARAASAMRHRNIIEVIDVGTLVDSGVPYMMMEFLDGESLASRIKRMGRLPVKDALEIAAQTADGLATAHATGIVHRDLKPDNLFLVHDLRSPGSEVVKILDFGIAKLRGEWVGDSAKTSTGSIMGTPPYMAPEQCRGLSNEIDARSDVYALGTILFEMLCGRPPFVSQGWGDVLMMHIMETPVSPSSLVPDVPEYLNNLILKSLAKRKEDRFQSMEELHQALAPERAIAGSVTSRESISATIIAPQTRPPAKGVPTTFSTAAVEIGPANPNATIRTRSVSQRTLLALGAAASIAVATVVLAGRNTSSAPTETKRAAYAPTPANPTPVTPTPEVAPQSEAKVVVVRLTEAAPVPKGDNAASMPPPTKGHRPRARAKKTTVAAPPPTNIPSPLKKEPFPI